MISILLVLFLLCPALALAQFTPTTEGQFTVHSSNQPLHGTPITTGPDGSIYIAYINAALDTVVQRKDVPGASGVWSGETIIEANTQNDPFHTQPSIAVDTNGFVHVVANMHNTPWQYWRSNSANSVAAFTFHGQAAGTNPGGGIPSEAGCTGQCEIDWLGNGIAAIPGNQITYAHFATDRKGTLYLAYRECFDCGAAFFSRQWSAGISKYDIVTQTWSRVGGIRPFAGGHATMLPIGLRLYADPRNRLHASWIWCPHYTQAAGSAACTTQSNNVTYAYSDDEGVTWRQANGTAMTLPLDPTETEVVSGPAWFDNVSAVGYYAGRTWITGTTHSQPLLMAFPQTVNAPLGIEGGYITYVNGAWTATPVKLPFAAPRVYTDIPGRWIAVSSGLRVHVSINNGATFTTTELDIADGPFTPDIDSRHLARTNNIRLYAHTSTFVRIYTLTFTTSPPCPVPPLLN